MTQPNKSLEPTATAGFSFMICLSFHVILSIKPRLTGLWLSFFR